MTSPELIQQMQQPEFYPHPVNQPIATIQTHISYVFLTGEYAYKLKKAVNFGFLDFSTLAKRQHFLQEEIRLNKATAPDIYLEVLPITKQENQYTLNGKGEAVEYVLKMRQFPQESLLINLFEQGKLTDKHLQELGKVTAQFHAQTETNEYILSFGTPEKINQSILENYQQTQKYIGIAQTQSQFIETKAFSDNFILRKDLFNQRIINKKIRECHGDLHLKNLCYWPDKIQLFDRIEFNEPFRFVDVMYDVAFAVMDLEARGCQDLANTFLNTYLEYTEDWAGVPLLPLYLSRQAYVRAKVTSFLLDDPHISPTEKDQAKQAAADYYRLAWEYTKQKQGQIILMSGLSGSGKTTVAKALAKQLNAIHIRSDAVRKHLAGISLDQQGGSTIYSPEMSQQTYEKLLALGLNLAQEGSTVILDAKYDRCVYRKNAIALARKNHIPLKIIACQAPTEILTERLNQRIGDISDATSDLIQQQKLTAEPFTAAELDYVTLVDTTKNDGINQLRNFFSEKLT